MTQVSMNRSVEYEIAGRSLPLFRPSGKEGWNAVADEELVERSLRGESDAFRHLYERYRRPVYVAVCRIIVDREEARDATQEIFIAVYRSLSLYDPRRARFFAWIYRVAANRAIDYWRLRRRRAEVPLSETMEASLRRLPLGRKGMRAIEKTVEQCSTCLFICW